MIALAIILMVLAITVEGPLLWQSTNTTHDDLPPTAPCHASEAEFSSIQCPPANRTGLGY
jgi:hypothetical protein